MRPMRYTFTRTRAVLMAGAGVAGLLGAASQALAQVAPSLGSAQTFAVLGGQTVTNTGPSVVTGDLGVSPGSAVTGFPPGSVLGTSHAADASALSAQTSVVAAYDDLAGQVCTQDLTGQDLGGQTLTPGVYCFLSSAQLTGPLTLDAEGNANAVFIFQIGSTLTTASMSSVVVINGGSLCNVFWQVGSSATLGTDTTFAGSILALTSITLNTGANVTGRTLARNGAVTLDSNRVTVTCPSGAPSAGACGTIALAPAALPNGSVSTAYNQTITASGGMAPYTFTVNNGTLPPGLSLSPTGVLSGTPTAGSTSSFTVRAIDASGCFADRLFSLSVVTAVPALPVPLLFVLALALAGLGALLVARHRRPA